MLAHPELVIEVIRTARRTRCQGIDGSLKRVGDRGGGRQGNDGHFSLDEGGVGSGGTLVSVAVQMGLCCSGVR